MVAVVVVVVVLVAVVAVAGSSSSSVLSIPQILLCFSSKRPSKKGSVSSSPGLGMMIRKSAPANLKDSWTRIAMGIERMPEVFSHCLVFSLHVHVCLAH